MIDSTVLDDIVRRLMAGNIVYHMDGNEGKCSDLENTEPEDIARLDCSGLVQYVFYQCTTPHIRIPSGSDNQRGWFNDEGYPLQDYAQVAHRKDSMLRIAFRHSKYRERRRVKVGHVWFVLNGATIESTQKGRRNGPASFPWNERANEAQSCFFIGLIFPPLFEMLSGCAVNQVVGSLADANRALEREARRQ